MKERLLRIMDELPPTFFSKLGEAMKLVEQYRQLLIMDSKGIEVEKEGASSPSMKEKFLIKFLQLSYIFVILVYV
jgi:hypothetical protein